GGGRLVVIWFEPVVLPLAIAAPLAHLPLSLCRAAPGRPTLIPKRPLKSIRNNGRKAPDVRPHRSRPRHPHLRRGGRCRPPRCEGAPVRGHPGPCEQVPRSRRRPRPGRDRKSVV